MMWQDDPRILRDLGLGPDGQKLPAVAPDKPKEDVPPPPPEPPKPEQEITKPTYKFKTILKPKAPGKK